VRAGRANPSILDRVHVDYYGAPTPIGQMAAISVAEARNIVISPWDASSLKAIEKAILASDLGVNPQNDGKVIRISFPSLTEERRKELVKIVHKYAEDGKVAIRSIRREAIEDDLKDSEKDMQELTDKYCKEIDILLEKKQKEIMEV
jgi:ribosome recycling factor